MRIKTGARNWNPQVQKQEPTQGNVSTRAIETSKLDRLRASGLPSTYYLHLLQSNAGKQVNLVGLTPNTLPCLRTQLCGRDAGLVG